VAAGQVKGALLLHSLAEKTGIVVDDAAIEARLQKIASDSGQEYERISKYYLQNADAKQNLEEQVREELVLALIAAKATIIEKEKGDPAAASAA
jgi:FKBP-type peptidyl-prolyl cis-trans isomerase (trigger factor)